MAMLRARNMRRLLWPLRLLLRLLASVGITVVVLLLALLAFLLCPPADLLRRAALPIARQALRHERLELGALSLSLRPRGEIELRDLWLGPPAGYAWPLLTVQRIVVRYDATRILSGELHVRQLQVERPILRVEARRGKLNWLAFLAAIPPSAPRPEEPGRPSDLRVWLDRVSVIGIGALVDDGQRRAALDSLHVALSGLYSSRRSHLDVALRLEPADPGRATLAVLQRGPHAIGARLRTHVSLDAAVDELERPRGSVALDLDLASDELRGPFRIAPIRLATHLRARADIPGDRAELQELRVDLDGDELVRLRVALEGLAVPRQVELLLSRLHLPLAKLAPYARAVVGPRIDFGGEVELRDVHVAGSVAALQRQQLPPRLDGVLELRGVWARLARPRPLQIAGLDGALAFAARRGGQALITGPRDILHALPALTERPSPELLGTRTRMAPLAVQGRIRIGLARAAGAEVRDAALRLAAGSAVRGTTPTAFGALVSLVVPVHYQHPRLGPLRAELRTTLRASGDLARRSVAVESDVSVDDLLRARLAATAQDCGARREAPKAPRAPERSGQGRCARSFVADLEVQPIDLGRALRRLPSPLRAALGKIAAEGKVGLRLKVRGRTPTTTRQLPVAVDARVALAGVSLHDRQRGIAVTGLDGEVSLRGRPADLILATTLHVAAAGAASGPSTTVDLSAALPLSYHPGRGPAPLPQRPAALRLAVRPIPLPLLRRFVANLPAVEGTAAVEVNLAGSFDDPQLKARVRVEHGRWDRLTALDGEMRLSSDSAATSVDADLAWPRAEGSAADAPRAGAERQQTARTLQLRTRLALGLRAALDQALAPGGLDLHKLGAVPLDVRLELATTALATLLKLAPPARTKPPPVAGTAQAALRVRGTVLQPRVDLRLDLRGVKAGLTTVRHLESRLGAEVSPGQTRASLDLALDGRALLAARGSAAFDLEQLLKLRGLPLAPIQLTATIPPLELQRLGAIDRRLGQLGGKLTAASVHISGTTRLPGATVALALSKARIGAHDIGDLRLDASVAGVRPRLEAKLRLRRPEGGVLDGELKLPLRGGPLAARLQGKRLDLAFLRRLDPSVQESAGTLDLDLRAAGSLDQPTVNGSVELHKGALQLRGLSRFKDLNLQLKLDPRRVRLVELSGRSGDGRVSITGGVDLRPWRAGVDPATLLGGFDVKLDARRFRIDAGPISNAVFTGRVGVTGALKDRKLSARVRLEEASLRVPSIEGQKQLHSTAALEDVVFVDARASKARAAAAAAVPPIGLDLTLHFDPLFVRGEEVDLEVASDLRARTDRRRRLRLSGRVEIRRGTVRVLGNPFEVRQAILLFSGEPVPDPGLQIQLTRRTPQAVLAIGLQGTLSAPELDLSSDPPIYDRGQIMSLILTGRADVRQSSADGDQSLAVAGAVAQVLLGSVARKLAPKIGIDVARVGLSESKDKQTGASSVRAEAEVGRYITQRLYLGYRRVFGSSAEENSNEGLLEYSISVKWLLTALFGDASVGGLDIFWSHRY